MQKALSLEDLLRLDWDPRTLQFYEYLKESEDPETAKRYLQVSYQADLHPSNFRGLEIAFDPFVAERSRRNPVTFNQITANLGGMIKQGTLSKSDYHRVIKESLLNILHPQQLPMSWQDVECEFFRAGFAIKASNTVYKWLNQLEEEGLLRKLPNPYKGQRLLYCHKDFKESPQVGDRVIELMRRRGSRIGTVVRFRTYRDQNRYPVVNWEYSVKTQKPLACQFESFANPESLVVIERPQSNPITRRSAS